MKYAKFKEYLLVLERNTNSLNSRKLPVVRKWLINLKMFSLLFKVFNILIIFLQQNWL